MQKQSLLVELKIHNGITLLPTAAHAEHTLGCGGGGMAFLCFRQLLDQQCVVVTHVCERQTLPQVSKASCSKLINILGKLIILQSHKQITQGETGCVG